MVRSRIITQIGYTYKCVHTVSIPYVHLLCKYIPYTIYCVSIHTVYLQSILAFVALYMCVGTNIFQMSPSRFISDSPSFQYFIMNAYCFIIVKTGVKIVIIGDVSISTRRHFKNPMAYGADRKCCKYDCTSFMKSPLFPCT